jgi:predicted  nucleic acid-binding Zn-ribbon protein
MSTRHNINREDLLESKNASNERASTSGTIGLKSVMAEIKNLNEDLASVETRLKKMEDLLKEHSDLHVSLNKKLNDIIDS